MLENLTSVLVLTVFVLVFLVPVNFLIGLAVLKVVSVLVKNKSRSKFKLKNNADDEIRDKNSYLTIGFFHPFCNSGGGGERVLWSAVKAIQDT